jgi:hypothetical protein
MPDAFSELLEANYLLSDSRGGAYGVATHGLIVDIRLGAHPEGRGITNVQVTQSFEPLPDGE